MILLIDNYDSFAHNLARYLTRLGQEVRVERNDAMSVASILKLAPSAIVLSPGPCTPREAGVSLELVAQARGRIPLLGVCLGHQTIAAALGGRIVRAAEPMHGRTSHVTHVGAGLFAGLPQPLTVCRYHSLIVERATLPVELSVTATTEDGTIMALESAAERLWGVQFHPEAILTECGYELLANFLRLAGLPVPNGHATRRDEWTPAPPAPQLPAGPVTF